ncbi:unnamed protein product [Sphagnum jensenii]
MCVDTISTSSFLSCILHNNNDKKSAKVQLRVMTFALLNTKPNIPLQVRRDVLPHHPTKGCGTYVSRCVTLAA